MTGKRNDEGFTLIELMVVIVIIGILVALIVPNITKQADRAKEKRAIAELTLMKSIIDAYHVENGEYPKDVSSDYADSITTVLVKNGIGWELKDPWGQNYVYVVGDANDTYEIYSEGSDSYDIWASNDKEPQIRVSTSSEGSGESGSGS